MELISMRVILAVALAIVLHLGTAVGSMMYQKSANQNHRDTIETLGNTWGEEDTIKRTKHDDRLLNELGVDKFDRIVCDQRLDIQLVLKKLSLSVAEKSMEKPSVEVDVERFTEYSVLVWAEKTPNSVDIANYLKEVFSRINPEYVHQFTITDGKDWRLINHRKLLAVTDWKEASVDEIINKCLKL